MSMESTAFYTKKQACILFHLVFWLFNSWTWNPYSSWSPTISQKCSKISWKAYQNKHGLLDFKPSQQTAVWHSQFRQSFWDSVLRRISCALVSWAFCQFLLNIEQCKLVDELVKASVLMMHKPVAITSPSLVPSHLFLNSSKILLPNITKMTYLFTAKTPICTIYQYQQSFQGKILLINIAPFTPRSSE